MKEFSTRLFNRKLIYLPISNNDKVTAIFVSAKPTMLIESTQRVHVNIGESIELRCVATGYPKVSFEWLFTYNYEQIRLKASEQKSMFKVSRTQFQHFKGKELSTSVLKIDNVNQRHWGKYKCLAENSNGYDDVRFLVEGYSKLFFLQCVHKKRNMSYEVICKSSTACLSNSFLLSGKINNVLC